MNHQKSKRVVCFFTGLIISAAVSCLYAQQSADVEVWRKDYDYIAGVISYQLQRKPHFEQDLRFSNPDYVVFVPKVEPWILGDTYNDHFQVFDTPKNNTLFVVWCQATAEGSLDQHVAFSRSFDKGKTWEPVHVLAGNRTIAEGIANGGVIASWGFPLVSKSGRIYILYNQFVPGKVSTYRQHTGIMMGIYSDDDGDTWTQPEEITMPRSIWDAPDTDIPSEWCVWQKPLRLGKNGAYLVGVTRYVHPAFHEKHLNIAEFIHFDNVDNDPPIKALIVRWVQRDDKALRIGAYCAEPAIVKLPDGRLFAVMRTGMASPYWTQSRDAGETWSDPKPLLMRDGGEPVPHPMSPCPIYDAKGNEAASGQYFLFAHNLYDHSKGPYQNRGPLYLFSGRFQEDAQQPVWFDEPKPFNERSGGNSFYTSITVVDDKTVLWYPDQKFFLLGKVIGNEVADSALYAALAKRTWQGIPGVERTVGGRLFFSWFTGGTREPEPGNMAVMCYSDDDGKTHSPLQVIGAPWMDGTRAFDPGLWIDPKGRLWYLYSRGNKTTRENGVYVRICDEPDAEKPVFGAEFKIELDVSFAFRLNKLTVLSTGEWLMPISYTSQTRFDEWRKTPVDSLPSWVWEWFPVNDQLQGVAISRDEGKTWKLNGAVKAPPWALECMIVELKDGRLWMLTRSDRCVWESYSTDRGMTWSEGQCSNIESPTTRFFIRRLSSGNLLLISHYIAGRDASTWWVRNNLTAKISTDDGKTWNEGLMLDERTGVSYPDGVEDKDGIIRIIYDYNRYAGGYILMAKFREEDVMQGKDVSGEVLLQQAINQISSVK